jgi:periplasmic protein TonB
MTATAADRDDLRRWVLCGALVLGLHAGGGAMLARWHEPVVGDDASNAIVVDLAPFVSPEKESQQDLAPGPETMTLPQPEKPEEKVPEKAEEKIEPPPPVPNPEVVLPREEVKPPNKPKEKAPPPPPQMTAPPRPRAPSSGQVSSWHRSIVAQIERHKGYPAAAQARREQGVAQLAFTIDRQGHVTASRVVRSSGFAALDQETVATVRRAQPFPPPPPNLPGATFDFTLPIGFHIR